MRQSAHDVLMKVELVNARFTDLIKLRFPWLVVGLTGGLMASFIISQFELSLRENISLAFFISVIAYMSDAMGTQTETVFIRAITDLKFNITKYIFREVGIGLTLGGIFGVLAGIVASLIANSSQVGIVVGLSLFLSMTVASLFACLTPIVLKSFKQDPAVGSGPFTTAIQDLVSLTIYFTIATLVLR